jgi:hypothetical protein
MGKDGVRNTKMMSRNQEFLKINPTELPISLTVTMLQ